MHQTNVCNLSSLLSLALTAHEWWVQGVCVVSGMNWIHAKIIVYNNSSILPFRQFDEISIILNNNVNIIQKGIGDY